MTGGAGREVARLRVLDLVAVIALAAAVRLAVMFDDFWLDEIWSWRIAQSLRSAADVLLSPTARVDNNHPLNTLLMYWMGDRGSDWVYRVPSLLAGVGAVVLGAWHVRRRFGAAEGVCAAILLGLSYPLVHYSTEARGYALMVFFAVACWVLLDRYLARPSWWTAAGFSAAAVLGFLSHLTFAHFYLAALVWSAWSVRRESRGPLLPNLVRCHAVPVAFAVWLYFAFARRMTIGGAPDTSLTDVVVTTLSVMIGGPIEGAGRVVPAVFAAALTAASLAVVWLSRDRGLFAFFLTCVLLSPAAFVAMQALSMRGAETLFPRYFLVSMTFAYVLWAVGLGSTWRRGRRPVVLFVVLGFSLASLYQVSRLAIGTRGHYADAIRHMAEATPGEMTRVGSDNPFRTGMLLEFHARRLPAGEQVRPVLPSEGGAPADWFVINTPQAGTAPPPEVTVDGMPFRFDREFTYRGLSGWSWYLYRRAGTGTAEGSGSRR